MAKTQILYIGNYDVAVSHADILVLDTDSPLWQFTLLDHPILALFLLQYRWQYGNWMAGWYTFGLEFLFPMTLTLSINNALGFTSLKSWIFSLKFTFIKNYLSI